MAALGDWLTVGEGVRETGYNPEQIRRLARAGRIKAQKWGKDWMIDKNSLLEYLKSEGHGPQIHKGLDKV